MEQTKRPSETPMKRHLTRPTENTKSIPRGRSSKPVVQQTVNPNPTKLADPPARTGQLVEETSRITRKDFCKFKIFLDSVDDATRKNVERKLKLLGVTLEPFFSKNCTHFITTKPFTPPKQTKQINAEISTKSAPLTEISNRENNSDFKIIMNRKQLNPFGTGIPTRIPAPAAPPQEELVDKAFRLNLQVWGLHDMLRCIQTILDGSNRSQRKEDVAPRGLANVLKEEKTHGVRTGIAGDANSSRPHFVPFKGYYALVEDVTGVCRPTVIKEYTKSLSQSAVERRPWPFLKDTPYGKSPFAQAIIPDDSQLKTGASGSQEQQFGRPTQTANRLPLGTHGIVPLQPKRQTTRQIPSDSLFRVSGFHPSVVQSTTSRTALASGSTMVPAEGRHLAPGDNVGRLTRRTVEVKNTREPKNEAIANVVNSAVLNFQQMQLNNNNTQDNQVKPAAEKTNGQTDRRGGNAVEEVWYCENCNRKFSSYEKHIKEDAHQAFIRDSNNFSVLDDLLSKTRRSYKEPLPLHMKPKVDPNIDGKNVRFQHSNKRSYALAVATNDDDQYPNKFQRHKIEDNEDTSEMTSTIVDDSWEKYYSVFL
ncbi:Dfp1/Him1, central region-domain-containing protein [Phycomyces blakesleeanus]|uniref:Dfp1/Him1, central region-domain-containing protein n=1 Tax=Phycomyces blakesleeanus TaxID=4837 RepID=A0ABR3ALM0_PHYBL